MNLRSEKGVALIIVLLLLAVMSGLTTGLTLNGQTEIAMAQNELHYAGARAAAEAGLHRAVEQITANTELDLVATGEVPVILNGPFALNAEYSYRFELLDDDDPSLYPEPLTPEQLDAMCAGVCAEDGLANSDQNNRLILRSIGTGPKGTQVTLGRILSQTVIPDIPVDDTLYTDPAILVNGNLEIAGNAKVLGEEGNVHANGNITGGGSEEISGDVTATGTIDDDIEADGMVAGNQPAITVPEIKANDFRGLADWVLTNNGEVRHPTTNALCTSACPSGWSFNNTTKHWSASGAMPTAFTYYIEGSVSIHGTGASSMTKLSIIAEGNITLTGNGKFKPANTSGIQFVTNGDFSLSGNVDADDAGVDMDGQILVREQFDIRGNSKFQGRVMVENRASADNAWSVDNPHGRRGDSVLDLNAIGGNMRVTYNGGLDDVETPVPGVPGDPTYTNNISGWIEQ
jgi:hypothetical protein